MGDRGGREDKNLATKEDSWGTHVEAIEIGGLFSTSPSASASSPTTIANVSTTRLQRGVPTSVRGTRQLYCATRYVIPPFASTHSHLATQTSQIPSHIHPHSPPATFRTRLQRKQGQTTSRSRWGWGGWDRGVAHILLADTYLFTCTYSAPLAVPFPPLWPSHSLILTLPLSPFLASPTPIPHTRHPAASALARGGVGSGTYTYNTGNPGTKE